MSQWEQVYSEELLQAVLPSLATLITRHIQGLITCTYSLVQQLLLLPLVVHPEAAAECAVYLAQGSLHAPFRQSFAVSSCSASQLSSAAAAVAAAPPPPLPPGPAPPPAMSPPSGAGAGSSTPGPALGSSLTPQAAGAAAGQALMALLQQADAVPILAGWNTKRTVLLLDPAALDSSAAPTQAGSPAQVRSGPSDIIAQAVGQLGWQLIRAEEALRSPAVSSLPEAEALKRVAEPVDLCVIAGPPQEAGSALPQLRSMGLLTLLASDVMPSPEVRASCSRQPLSVCIDCTGVASVSAESYAAHAATADPSILLPQCLAGG